MAKKTTGEIQGRVMRKNCRQAGVPSMTAASRMFFGTPCRAAMKMIMKKPVFFQTSMMMIEVIAWSASVSQRTAGRPTGAGSS